MNKKKLVIMLTFSILLMGIHISNGGDTDKSLKPNVVFITIDTLRADYIGIIKERTVHTPAIDSIAQSGWLFINMITAVPLTLPSHISIFTGTYPPTHKVRNNGQLFNNPTILTLASILKQNNYHTYAITASYVLHSRFGLAKDFDYYSNVRRTTEASDNISLQFIDRNANAVLEESKTVLSNIKKPFFIWIHFYDPHSPYNPPEEFLKRNMNNPYQGEVEYVDSAIAQLFDNLQKKGLFNDTIFIIASDHGESLNEHHEKTHGHFLYNSTLRVPLIIKTPELKPQKFTAFVSTVDIAPTLLDILKIPIPQFMEGVSLLNHEQTRSSENSRILYSETFQPFLDYHWAPLQSLINKNLKYISAPKAEFYNMQKDPAEVHNSISTSLYEPQFWKKKLKNFQNTAMAEPQNDAATKEMLLSLGYAGGSNQIPVSYEEMNKLPDPKDKINDLNIIYDVMNSINAKNFQKALDILTGLLAKDNTNVTILYLMSYSYNKIGDWNKAIEYIKKAAALNPIYLSQYLLLKADFFRKQNNLAEAEKNYLEVIKISPQETSVYNNLAQIAFFKHDFGSALIYMRKLVEYSPEDLDAKNNLAFLLISQNQFDEAKSIVKSILESQPDHQYALINLTNIYIKTNEYEKAYESGLKLLAMNPLNEKYSFQIINICLHLGKINEANSFRVKLADNYENQGLFNKALAQLVEVQKSDPDNAGILARIEKLRQQAK